MDRRRSGRRNIKPKKSLVQKCKDCLRQFIAFLFSNVGIICLVVGYTVGGAVMFQHIESDYTDKKDFKFTENDYNETNVDEDEKHFQFNDNEYNDTNTFAVNLDIFCNKTVEILWHFASSKVGLNQTEFMIKVERKLTKFQNIVVNGVKDLDYDGKFIYSDRWTISAAFLYCLTVITTIGYGNVFPRSVLGKVATIVYAIFGMPLFLLYLSNIGDLLAKSFKWLYAKFCLCKICRLRRRRILNGDVAAPAVPSLNSWRTASEKTWPNSNLDIRSEVTEGEESDDEDTDTSKSSSTVSTKDPQDITVPISLCLAIMIGFISIGALLFSGQEGLDFLDGSYFCFISLSTIGFGDIVPTTSKDSNFEPNFILCSVYLMLGMALIAMCFNLMQQDVVQKIRTCTDIVRRIARCRR